jgi:hypothetical protein
MSLSLLVAALLAQAPATDRTASVLDAFGRHNQEARAARERGDMAAYLRHVREIHALLPDNANVRYAMARALASNGRSEEPLRLLESLAEDGFAHAIREEAAFAGLARSPDFVALAERFGANEARAQARTAARIPLPDALNGEGVAWSASTAGLLLGGRDGIYVVGRDGAGERRLIAHGGQILGVRPDPSTGTFLACVNDPHKGIATVVRHALADGRILAVYPLPAANALCNDIAILANGRFAVTDSNNSRAFILSGSGLVPLPLAQPVIFGNGIAADPASLRLFVAGANAIFVHDLGTGMGWELETEPTTASAIDGLVWHQGSLIGVQNQTNPPRLLQIRPDAEAKTARVDVLAADRGLLGGSTTVAVDGEHAFVISRSGEGASETPFLVRVPL